MSSVENDGEAEVCDHAEVDKLIEFFRKEGYMRFGLNGDNMGWSPAETAIRAMREYMSKEAKGFLTDDISALPDVWRAYVKERRFEIGELVEDAVKACANDLESALIDAQYSITHR